MLVSWPTYSFATAPRSDRVISHCFCLSVNFRCDGFTRKSIRGRNRFLSLSSRNGSARLLQKQTLETVNMRCQPTLRSDHAPRQSRRAFSMFSCFREPPEDTKRYTGEGVPSACNAEGGDSCVIRGHCWNDSYSVRARDM